MRTLELPSGRLIPVLGQGTWRIAEDRAKRRTEVESLRLGLDLGMTLIDTAEMYGEGAAEELIAEAIDGRRAEVFLVSKVYPHNAGRRDAKKACERSLRKLGTDYLDLYLLHWKGAIALAETFEAFHELKQAGKIRDFGVSNFDRPDMQETKAQLHGGEIATNQVLYNLKRRGIEWDLLPWCRRQEIPVMAYSPFEHSPVERRGMFDHPDLIALAQRHRASPAQIALAWLLHQDGVAAIPKAATPEHVRQNRAALELQLTKEDLTKLDQAFPPPTAKVPLGIR